MHTRYIVRPHSTTIPVTMTARMIPVIVVAVIVVLLTWAKLVHRMVPIHDITTDTHDPPQFVVVLSLRAAARNSAVYGGDDVAAIQRDAYPDIAPVDLAVSPAAAFAKAHAAAIAMGWALISTDSGAGRIEATATTRLFRFKDDIVIRVRSHGGGSRVDVRSASRIGKSDVGKNAARVRESIERLRPRAGVRSDDTRDRFAHVRALQ